jgi:hypothetical protein
MSLDVYAPLRKNVAQSHPVGALLSRQHDWRRHRRAEKMCLVLRVKKMQVMHSMHMCHVMHRMLVMHSMGMVPRRFAIAGERNIEKLPRFEFFEVH